MTASAAVLDRLARALLLTEAEREYLFMLGLGRPPEARYQAPGQVEPRLQRVLDALKISPALVKTATWDIVAWNRAATVLFTDYAALPPRDRNLLRLLFGDSANAQRQPGWEAMAGFVVAAFRADAARAGASQAVAGLVEELSASSALFARLWRDNDVVAGQGSSKRIRHPLLGLIELEGSTFAVDGRHDLALLVHNLVRAADISRLEALLERAEGP